MQKQHSNKLIRETSPYLLQHAHNPVDWYPWGAEALNRARTENKPILVSIGYSACHWCHVMERESFEDESTAALMNEHFINIKIDREERPDLDHIYMDAVQAMTGSGGWPLNVFLTPDGKPFYGGTYFPPQKAFNRPSWAEILQGVSAAFKDKRHEIDAQAENLTEHLIQSNSFGLQAIGEGQELLTKEVLDDAFQNIMKSADKTWGGFGNAPKFPQTFTIQFLLRYHYIKQLQGSKASKASSPGEGLQEAALTQATLSLDKMIEGGIYDQVGGGFARYSTDTEWLVPHFEKMLYDNALLVQVLAEVYQLTGKELYREVIEETLEFVQRELQHPEGGFYAALDADSEGVEGKFYVWTYEEVNQILGKDAPVFCEYFDITKQGNWEEKNIPRIKQSLEKLAALKNMEPKDLRQLLKKGKKKLLEERNKRIAPSLDDKIILGWNALMNTAISKAFAATGHEKYRELAVGNMQFLLEKFRIHGTEEFHHTWKNGQAKHPGFLDDYACLIQALLQLQEITGNTDWLLQARNISQFVIDNFSEKNTGYFFYTKQGQEDIIVRKKEVYDGAVPSGNSIMANNLYQLSLLLDRPEWKQRGWEMVSGLGKAVIKYPTSFGNWACLLLEVATGTNEIAILGKDPWPVHKELLKEFIPNRILMTADEEKEWPLLSGKTLSAKTNIWLCRNYTCRQPVPSVKELITLINRGEAG